MSQNIDDLVRTWTRGTIVGGFCIDAGYYSGRPPSRGDINDKVLEALYVGLQKDVSQIAARNFVRFLNKLQDLSASSFAIAFKKFWESGCKNENVQQNREDRTAITAYGGAAEVQAMGILAEVFCGEKKTESDIRRLSDDIKSEFISNHWEEIPKAERGKIPHRSYW